MKDAVVNLVDLFGNDLVVCAAQEKAGLVDSFLHRYSINNLTVLWFLNSTLFTSTKNLNS